MKPATLILIGALLGIALLAAAGLVAAGLQHDAILHSDLDER